MNATLLDKSLSLPFFFLVVTDRVPIYTKLGTVEERKLQVWLLYSRAGGSITKLWHLGHQESALKDYF